MCDGGGGGGRLGERASGGEDGGCAGCDGGEERSTARADGGLATDSGANGVFESMDGGEFIEERLMGLIAAAHGERYEVIGKGRRGIGIARASHTEDQVTTVDRAACEAMTREGGRIEVGMLQAYVVRE